MQLTKFDILYLIVILLQGKRIFIHTIVIIDKIILKNIKKNTTFF